MLASCPKAFPWHLDTLMKHFVLTFALAIIIILLLLFIDFHKLFTEQVKYYCNYHNYDDNDNKNNIIIGIPDFYVFRVPVNSWQQEGHVTKSHLPLKHPKFQLLDLQAVITRIISITFSFIHFLLAFK